MQDARTRIALLVICLACLLGSGFVLFANHPATPKPIVITPPPVGAANAASSPAAVPLTIGTSPTPAPRLATRVYVDVAGAVRRPSVYLLPPDSRVMQAILAAGGPAADADMDSVNLAQKVTDGEKVLIPNRAAASLLAPRPAQAQTTPPLPPPSISAKGSKSGSGSRSNKINGESGEQVALNTATEQDLERLPTVGPSMAARILAFRQQAGGFGKIEDLTLITGIGPKKFAKIAPFVKLN